VGGTGKVEGKKGKGMSWKGIKGKRKGGHGKEKKGEVN
jgi:hypothetical protein